MTKERPVITNLVNANTSKTEKFQNEVLRPIIKMQNDLFIAFFIEYLKKRKINFSSLSDEKKSLKIKSVFEKDVSLKNMVLGIVIGNFTEDEYGHYCINTSEFNKRIVQIVVQRLQSKISFLNV